MVMVRVRVKFRVSIYTIGGRMYVPPLFPGYEKPADHQILDG